MKVNEKMLRNWGVEDPAVQKNIMKGLNGEENYVAELEKKVSDLEEALGNEKKQAAVEKAILEAGGKHVKAILGLIDMEDVTYDEKKGLKGLDMDEIKEEAPYLFYEKEEKKKGTGITKSSQKKREDDIRAAFWGLK
ncbi:MAG: phage scaffolding protein [Anaerotignum sp.]|nr:phage scaffolding protein [Anaerotignum sp.]